MLFVLQWRDAPKAAGTPTPGTPTTGAKAHDKQGDKEQADKDKPTLSEVYTF